MNKFRDESYALLRIASGFMFSIHGFQKVFGVLTDRARPEFPTQMWFGGMIELIGGLLVMLGLWTRSAAFIASGTMAVAYTQFHWDWAFDANFFPAVNHGETALLYAFVFLFIAAKGSGMWALKRD